MLLEVILILVLSVVLYQVLYIHYLHRKYSQIPGPPRPSFFFGHALQIRKKINEDGSVGTYWLEMVRQYGKIFQFWFFTTPGVCLADPVAIRDLVTDFSAFLRSTDQAREYFARQYSFNTSRMGTVRFCGFDTLLTSSGGPVWKHKKKILDPAFSTQRLTKHLSKFHEIAVALIDTIEAVRIANPGALVDLDLMTAHSTTDAISKAGFSANSKNIELLRSVDPRTRQKALEAIISKGANRVTLMIDPVSRKKIFDAASDITKVRGIGKSMVMDRISDGSLGKVDDILDFIISANMDKESGDLNVENCLDEFMSMYLAGTATTKTTLFWCLAELTRNPHTMDKLVDEVDKLWKSAEITSETDSYDMGEVLKKMDYLEAVVKETLRFHPPVQIFRRYCNKNVRFCGYDIPRGTMVVGSQYAMHLWEEHWDNPGVFDPERFINSSPKPYTYIPFFLGPRQCIGKNFALLELKILLCELLKTYKIARDESQPLKIKSAQTILCMPKHDHLYHFTPRIESE